MPEELSSHIPSLEDINEQIKNSPDGKKGFLLGHRVDNLKRPGQRLDYLLHAIDEAESEDRQRELAGYAQNLLENVDAFVDELQGKPDAVAKLTAFRADVASLTAEATNNGVSEADVQAALHEIDEEIEYQKVRAELMGYLRTGAYKALMRSPISNEFKDRAKIEYFAQMGSQPAPVVEFQPEVAQESPAVESSVSPVTLDTSSIKSPTLVTPEPESTSTAPLSSQEAMELPVVPIDSTVEPDESEMAFPFSVTSVSAPQTPKASGSSFDWLQEVRNRPTSVTPTPEPRPKGRPTLDELLGPSPKPVKVDQVQNQLPEVELPKVQPDIKNGQSERAPITMTDLWLAEQIVSQAINDYKEGRLTREQVETTIRQNSLYFEGEWWTIGIDSGKWYRHNENAKWILDDPYAKLQPHTTTREPQSSQSLAPESPIRRHFDFEDNFLGDEEDKKAEDDEDSEELQPQRNPFSSSFGTNFLDDEEEPDVITTEKRKGVGGLLSRIIPSRRAKPTPEPEPEINQVPAEELPDDWDQAQVDEHVKREFSDLFDDEYPSDRPPFIRRRSRFQRPLTETENEITDDENFATRPNRIITNQDLQKAAEKPVASVLLSQENVFPPTVEVEAYQQVRGDILKRIRNYIVDHSSELSQAVSQTTTIDERQLNRAINQMTRLLDSTKVDELKRLDQILSPQILQLQITLLEAAVRQSHIEATKIMNRLLSGP